MGLRSLLPFLLLLIGIYVLVNKKNKVIEKQGSSDEVGNTYVKEISLRKKREIDKSIAAESLEQRPTGGPSITQTLHSYSNDAMQDKGGGNGYFNETVPAKYLNRTIQEQSFNEAESRQRRYVDINCVNPVISTIDECIESMNKKVAEKCLPGITNILDNLESAYDQTKEGAYSIKVKESEVCLRDVFSRCTFESRFRIKTKFKQLVGLNLDIDFQEEFEIDCCDDEFMKDVICNVRECFNKLETPQLIGSSPEEISTELLDITGTCIEDHTAFTCVVAATDLFKDTMREIILILREETLKRLKEIGEDKYPHARLCLKWIDYDRLENCERDFFDFVLSLKNGARVPGLYQKVVDCFQKALRVCSPSTIKKLIMIIAGAMEGHGGQEPLYPKAEVSQFPKVVELPQLPQEVIALPPLPSLPKVLPSATRRPCGEPIILDWFENAKRCTTKQVGGPQDKPYKVKFPQGPYYEKQPLVPSYEKIPLVPSYEKVPLVPSYEKIPLVPSYEKIPQAPEYERLPQGPYYEKQPLVPSYEKVPLVPSYEKIPQGPGYEIVPQGPAYERLPQGPVYERLPQGPNFEGFMAPLFTCLKTGRPNICRFPKASQFIDASDKVNDLIDILAPPDAKIRKCIEQLKSPKLKRCLAQLFLYVVSLHHAHYTPEARNKLISKAKLCFRVVLKDCSPNFINRLIRTYLVIPNVAMPKIDRTTPTFNTIVTIPNGYVWCETRIIESRVPVPATSSFIRTPPEVVEIQTMTPTTYVPFEISQLPRTSIYKPRPVVTEIIPYPVPEKVYTQIITPTTTRIEIVTPPKRSSIYIPPRYTTKILTYPFLPKVFTQLITPTTTRVEIVTPLSKFQTHTYPPVKPVVVTFPPQPKIFTQQRTPTTTQRRLVTLPTVVQFETQFVPTQVVKFPPRPPKYTALYPFTTRFVPVPVKAVKVIQTVPPQAPAVVVVTPPPKQFVQVIPRLKTTTRILRIPVTPVFPQMIQRQTTLKMKIVESVPENCYGPPETGTCWFYNKNTNKCEMFPDRGCRGRGNSFETKEECERVCLPQAGAYGWKVPRICLHPPDVRVCDTQMAEIPRWFYNKDTDSCETFGFSGCGGNKNNFNTKGECVIVCVLPESSQAKTRPQFCYFPPERGTCGRGEIRWFFNKPTGTCISFVYSGCGGTGNNYKTREECESVCMIRAVTAGIYTWTPPQRVFEQRVTPTTTLIEVVTPPVKYPTRFVPKPRPEVIVVTPPSYESVKVITPTTHRQVEFSPPYRLKNFVVPQQKPIEEVYQPKQFTWHFQKPRTTTRKIYYPVTSKVVQERRKGTTLRVKVMERIPTVVQVQTLPTSKIKILEFPPKVVEFSQPLRPSTVKVWTMPWYDCFAPPEIGRCYAKHVRWYFNKEKNACMKFIYGGCNGNGNNFMTKEECEAKCIPKTFIGPLPKTFVQTYRPPPREYEIHRKPPTSRWITQTIPPGKVFKIAPPPKIEVFTVPPQERVVTQHLLPTTYKRIEIPFIPRTYVKTLPPIVPQGKVFTPPNLTYLQVFTPTTSRPFRMTVTPVIIRLEKETQTMKVKIWEDEAKPNVKIVQPGTTRIIKILPTDCYSPMVRGMCAARIPRWYYNKEQNRCIRFIYSGCQGNFNNFKTKEECEMTCMRIIMTPPTTLEIAVPVKPKQVIFPGRPIITRKVYWTPPQREYSLHRTPPTSKWKIQTVPPRVVKFEQPPPVPKVFTWLPQPREFQKQRFPTTSRIIAFPVTPKFYEQEKRPTTIQVKIKEGEVCNEKGQYAPVPKEVFFKPKEVIYQEERTPTSVVYVTEMIPTRIKQQRRLLPGTVQVAYPRPVPSFFQKITPTTIRQFEIPFTPRRQFFYPTVLPKVFTFKPQEWTRRRVKTPTTTVIWTQRPRPRPTMQFVWPPRKPAIFLKKVTPVTWGREFEVTPVVQAYPATPEEYVCDYPTPPTPVICEKIARKCMPGEELVWRDMILQCIMTSLRRKGKTIYEMVVVNKNIDELKKFVEQCIRWKGDTVCRDRTFPLAEWVLDKVVTYVGGYGEHAYRIDSVNDDKFHEMKTCVIMADEPQINQCLPRLYKALSDLIVYEKPTEVIPVRRIQAKCLQKAFRHCRPVPKLMIEERLENAFGTCIKITLTSEKSGCRHDGKYRLKLEEEENTCSSEELDTILLRMQACVDKEIRGSDFGNGGITKQHLLAVILKCEGKPPCEVHSSEHAMTLMSFLVSNLIKYFGYQSQKIIPLNLPVSDICSDMCAKTGGTCHQTTGICECPGNQMFREDTGCIEDKCIQNVNGMEARQCFQTVDGVLPRMREVQNPDDLMRPIKRCLASALRNCIKVVVQEILECCIKMICNKCRDFSPPPDYENYDGYVINKVGVYPSGIDVCGKNVFRTERPPARPQVEDDCIPVDLGGGEQFLIPACREDGIIDYWLKTTKECTEGKVTSIGLRDPDYLTLEKVILIVKECVNDRGWLHCRPKYREDFKRVMKVLLQLITTNMLAETSKIVRIALNYDKWSNKCKSILYKYLTFDTELEALKRSQAKAFDCLQQMLKDFDTEILELLLDVLDLAMVIDEDKIIKMHQQSPLQQCDFGIPKGNRLKFFNAPSFIACGPGGFLRKKRNVENQLHDTSDVIRNNATEKTLFLQPLDIIKRASSSECTADDFTKYFEKLQNCGQKRLRLKFRRKRNKCKLNDIKHSWTALVDCMIENIGGELTCQITSDEQMTQFLQHVGRILHTSSESTDDSCPVQPKCYGTEAPSLYKCSDHYLQLLETHGASVPMRDILASSLNVLECLNPIWPDCPGEVQFSALHFLYLPLGLNYDSSINRGLNFISCEDKLSLENSSYSGCMGKREENQVEDDPAFSSIETCLNCVKKKEGICTATSETDLIKVLEGELTRINACLKNFIPEDNCFKDITTRIEDKCLKEFHRFYKNVTKGIVLNSIEYFRKFNNCLTDFKGDCPENYKKFTIHLYYEVLGLSSVF